MAKSKKLTKRETSQIQKSPLGGQITKGKDFKTGRGIDLSGSSRDYQKEIEKTRKAGIPDVQEVRIKNKETGETSIVTIDRTGTTDKKLADIMLSPTSTQDQKDSVLSLYLFERGKESASFLAELFSSKGAHTKETRAFKTQMRRDYEIIIDTFVEFMTISGQSIIDCLSPGTSLEALEREALTFLKENSNGLKLKDFALRKFKAPADAALFMLALRFHSEGALLMDKVQKLQSERLRERGYGQYISPSGKVFDSSSSSFVADIIKDIEVTKQEKVEKQKQEENNGKESI